jgi:uncharacterized RDD family membrane protein YckC
MEHDDSLRIPTPEGVELELALAGVGSRFIAAGMDLAVQSAAAVIGALAILALVDDGVAVALLSTGGFLIFFCYDVAFEVLAHGRTPGKRWNGLRVTRERGEPVTFLTSAIRNIMRLVDILPVFYGVGMLVIFITRRNQRLGDLAAGTVVVRERRGGLRGGPDHEPLPAPAAAPLGWDTSAVTPRDAALVREFLERRHTLTADARRRIGEDLAARLRAKTAGAPPLASEAFLEALLAAREARR